MQNNLSLLNRPNLTH